MPVMCSHTQTVVSIVSSFTYILTLILSDPWDQTHRLQFMCGCKYEMDQSRRMCYNVQY